jgi:hypothetical protein
MTHAIELFFDPAADQAVRQAWNAVGPGADLPNHLLGIPTRPHVSLAVLNGADEAGLVSMLASLAQRHASFSLRLDSIGLFASDEGVLFLGPAPCTALLKMHHDCLDQLEVLKAQVSDYYRRDKLVFHCALNMHLDREGQARAAEAALALPLPIVAGIVEIGLVSLPDLRPVKGFALN